MRQPAKDVFDLIAHLNEEPPEYRILNWVHLEQKPKPLTEEQIQHQAHELSSMLGQRAGAIPEPMKEAMRWAEQQKALLNKRKR